MGRNQNKCFLHCLKKPQRAHVHLVPVGSKRVKWICFCPGFWVRVGKVAEEVRGPLLVVLGAPHTHLPERKPSPRGLFQRGPQAQLSFEDPSPLAYSNPETQPMDVGVGTGRGSPQHLCILQGLARKGLWVSPGMRRPSTGASVRCCFEYQSDEHDGFRASHRNFFEI